MSLHKESIRHIFKWILKNSDFETFLNLRLLNKECEKIATQEFNVIMENEKMIIGKYTYFFLNTCSVCDKKYDLKKENEKIWITSFPPISYRRMTLVYCDSLKCKMIILSSINKMIKKGFLHINLYEEKDKFVRIKRTNGEIEYDWLIQGGMMNDESILCINVCRGQMEKFVLWKNLKEINPKLEITFQTPFLMDKNWTDMIVKNNSGIKFHKNFKLEIKYHPE